LRALAEETERTVSEQDRLAGAAGTSSASAAAALDSSSGGGGGAGEAGGPMAAVVDSVMRHLLSKEVLYGPMSEIRDRYPPWLERNGASRPAAELDRYVRQHAAIVALCAQYERDASDFPALMALLQEMQACGEPPPEIVEEMSSAIAADVPGLMGGGGGVGGGAAAAGALGSLFGGGGSLGGLGGGLGGLGGLLDGVDEGDEGAEGADDEAGEGGAEPPTLEQLLAQVPPELLRDLPPELRGLGGGAGGGCPVQ